MSVLKGVEVKTNSLMGTSLTAEADRTIGNAETTIFLGPGPGTDFNALRGESGWGGRGNQGRASRLLASFLAHRLANQTAD